LSNDDTGGNGSNVNRYNAIIESPQKAVLQSQLAQIEAEISKLVDNLAAADNVLISFINRKARELDVKRQEVLKEMAKLSAENTLDTDKIRQINGYVDKWDSLSLEDKRLVCDTLIDVIHASNEKIQIMWKF